MYAMIFDDFKRKLQFNEAVTVVPQVLDTCIIHTPTWDLRIEQFLADNNKDVHLTIEPDGSTYTFYKLIDKVKAEA